MFFKLIPVSINRVSGAYSIEARVMKISGVSNKVRQRRVDAAWARHSG